MTQKMLLLTQMPLKKQAFNLLDYNATVFLMGSCFSENIGDKFSYYNFKSTTNPFGILFHPKAIEKLITNAVNIKKFNEEDIFNYSERWHSFDVHSSLSSSNKNDILANLNAAVTLTHNQLKTSTHIIITLGTAWVYREIASGKIVANCHKVPQKKFLKSILTVNEILENLEAIVTLIKSINQNATILFTVSPVRHLKDGFVENQQSKAHLLTAIHQLLDSTRNDIFYFPSYEIMLDELRDYRFYTGDMIHPNQTAINYIWEKFSHTWVSEEAIKTMNEVDTIQKGLLHKPFNSNSEAHQKFTKNLQEKKETLLQAFPFMKF